MHPLAVRADPGGAVAHAPLVLLEALRADLEAAGAVPAEGLLLFAAVAAKLLPAPAAFTLVLVCHGLSPRGWAATPAPSSRDRRQHRPPPGWQ